jgi:hypothetical protein
MISVILYGRNDSYGYNLHKRGVLSLNCIAEVLDDPDDEILFVDYNTPDDLPTFVEAIADMLTPKARRLVRTLRVRPAQHARFASQTHLRCLESPARNAALRRSNPRNRWMLATNTDMVFIPRSDKSLSAIAAGLPDGFYHTARFEIPEILWETLDRCDPSACIASIGSWGKRLQLNEVVYGYVPTIFDGPGDFQLFLRDDGLRIDGFDESMLLGWHVDTNIAVRLAMLRGKGVGSVLDHVFAYHCDHNRESTPAHAHGAVQNSWQRFVVDVNDYGAPQQRDTWGFNGEPVDEIRLDDASKIVAALESVIPSMGDKLYVTGITPETTDLRYDPEHVVPYLANAIGAFPREWSVGYAGCRAKTFALFASLWKALGFTGKIFVSNDTPHVAASPSNDPAIELASEADFHAKPDFFIVEMGAATDDASAKPVGLRESPEEGYVPLAVEDYVKLLRVHRAFVRAVVAEQEAGAVRRRFILVNMQSSAVAGNAKWRVGTVATPTGAHLTHGFALSDPFVKPQIDPIVWLQSRLSGVWPARRDSLEQIVDGIVAGADSVVFAGLGPVATDLARLLGLSDAPAVFGVNRERLDAIAGSLEGQRFSRRYASTLRDATIVDQAEARTGLTRIAALEDFDDKEWGKWAVRAWGPPPVQNRLLRNRDVWESTHILYALDRSKALGGTVLLLTHRDSGTSINQTLSSAIADWAGIFGISDITQPFPADPVYDGVVLSATATLAAGVENIPSVFTAVDKALRPGGVGVFVCDLALDRGVRNAIDLAAIGSGRFDALLEETTAWRMQKPLELSLSATTLDCADGSEGAQPLVRLDDQKHVRTSFTFVYRKEGVTSDSDWERYRAAFARRSVVSV